MQKIDFVNATHPAINDTNLNLMQDNIETAIQGAVSGDTLPIGAIMPFGGGSVPDDYLLCNGQAVSRTTYAQLFSVIGTNYGVGDGSTTFNVPNLKGKVPVGYDNTQTEFNSIGKTGGAKTVTLTKNNLPAGTVVNETGTIHIGTESGTVLSKTTAATAVNNLQPYNTTNYIIKAFQSAGTIATIVNAHSTSTTNAYSSSYINNISDYSTTEKICGYWINGKPIYRKVIDLGALPDATAKDVAHNINNIDEVVKIYGTYSNSSSSSPMPYASVSSIEYNVALYINGNYVRVWTQTDKTSYTGIAIIEYTKTTD